MQIKLSNNSSKEINRLGNLKRELPLHIMLLPGVIIAVIFLYIPIFGLVIAFQNYVPAKGILNSSWVGLKNFYNVFSMPEMKRAFFNTIFISSLKITLNFFVPIFFALLLNEVSNKFCKRGIQTLIYLPHFISWLIMSGIVIDLLSPENGIINQLIMIFGGEPIFFLADNQYFPFVLVFTDILKEFGWKSIVFLAALTGIDPSLYEAAVVDGAGRIKQTIHITIPGILPVAVLVGTLSLGHVLNAGFEQVYNLYSPVVYQSGDIIDTLVFRIGIGDARFSFATAIGLFKSVISFILITLSYRLADRFVGYKIF